MPHHEMLSKYAYFTWYNCLTFVFVSLWLHGACKKFCISMLLTETYFDSLTRADVTCITNREESWQTTHYQEWFLIHIMDMHGNPLGKSRPVDFALVDLHCQSDNSTGYIAYVQYHHQIIWWRVVCRAASMYRLNKLNSNAWSGAARKCFDKFIGPV